MKQLKANRALRSLGWFAVGFGTLLTIYFLLSIFIWTSPDHERTQSDAIGMGLSWAVTVFIFLVLPGLSILRAQARRMP